LNIKNRFFPIVASLLLSVALGCGGGGTGTLVSDEPANGDLDTTFGSSGYVTTTVGSIDVAKAVAIQSDSKIVVAGYHYNGSNNDLMVARYTTSGSLDTTFNASGSKPGVYTLSLGTGNDFAYAVAIQSDGKIVVVGNDYNAGHQRFALVRLTSAGALDTTFNGSGIVTQQIENASIGRSVVLDSSGNILVGGYAMPISASGTWVFALARFTSTGALDTSFGSDGIVTTDIGGTDDGINALALQSNGKIVAAGYSSDGTHLRFALARYNTDGSLDTSFSGDGLTTTAVTSLESQATSLIIQSDGKIVAAGGASTAGTGYDFALTRYTSSGSLDSSFGTSGLVTTDFSGATDGINSLLLQSDGKLLAAGASGNNFALTRYGTSGALDTDFGSLGAITSNFGAGTSDLYALAQQSDSRIVAAGSFYNGVTTALGLVRFYP